MLCDFFDHFGLTDKDRSERSLVKDLDTFCKNAKPKYPGQAQQMARLAIISCFRDIDGELSIENEVI